MQTKILTIFTRTPLHVGTGASVGAIDQPVIRERHTGFPIIPGSSLKGVFADHWNDSLVDEETNDAKKVRVNKNGEIAEAAWLFGSDSDKPAFAGSLIFSEARILAFPIRSAKGSYAWITCPLALQRAARDGAIEAALISELKEPSDKQAIFKTGDGSKLALPDNKIVLEEYCFSHTGDYPEALAQALAALIPDDPLFQNISDRLVILSNGIFTHFVTTTCEVAQHVRINDETGTAEGTGLFNQENVPADTLFYSSLGATNSRVPIDAFKDKSADDALNAFAQKVSETKVFQFGADASTGLGFTTVTIKGE